MDIPFLGYNLATKDFCVCVLKGAVKVLKE